VRGHRSNLVVGEPRAVLEAVDAGGQQVGKRCFSEDMCRHARAELVRLADSGDEHVGGPARAEVADLAVDPVTDDLHPAVSTTCLFRNRLDEVLRLDFHSVVA